MKRGVKTPLFLMRFGISFAFFTFRPYNEINEI